MHATRPLYRAIVAKSKRPRLATGASKGLGIPERRRSALAAALRSIQRAPYVRGMRTRKPPKPDGLRPLPDHVTAQLLRALMTLPRPRNNRLTLRRVEDARAPFYEAEHDYDVHWRGERAGRIHLDLRPANAAAAAQPWCWRISLAGGRTESARAATRKLAMDAFRAAWDALQAERDAS